MQENYIDGCYNLNSSAATPIEDCNGPEALVDCGGILCVCVCVCVCVYIYMCVYIYIYIYIYTHTHIQIYGD